MNCYLCGYSIISDADSVRVYDEESAHFYCFMGLIMGEKRYEARERYRSLMKLKNSAITAIRTVPMAT